MHVDDLLASVELRPATAGRNPIDWPGYRPVCAVRWGRGPVTGHQVVAVIWDFSEYGGSYGEAEADAFAAACAEAVAERLPLLTVVRSGGTRVQEGMAALVGIPRSVQALDALAEAGLPHIAVADHPTTGGVWVGIVSQADLRAGLAGATVAFTGPRVVEVMTGERLPPGAHTAESAFDAGLLDAVPPRTALGPWVSRALGAWVLRQGDPASIDPPPPTPERHGWAQVQASRKLGRPGGAALLDALLDDLVELRGDASVRAVAGHSASGRPTVGVALAATRDARPTPRGYRLLERAATTASRLGSDLLLLVDTPGAEPGAESEAAGIAPSIAAAMRAVLACASPTLAVVHGEGGSGGALAASVADRVLVTPLGYFTALAPEGAAAALRLTPEEAADRAALAPADLLRLGFADAMVPAEPDPLRRAVTAELAALAAIAQETRLTARRTRWSNPLPGGP
ncbi:MAG: acyl-CoA carboxylase subunit beta [Frankiales bacterium]|nr:acyl-CoA carboxylase subunit beta [Frankiales bacterium]